MSIEGIPEGWELVRVGCPTNGEFYLGMNGQPIICNLVFHGCAYIIIRKIPKPKQYRPFANGAEFKPHRDRWWMFGDDIRNHRRPPQDYDDRLYGSWEWEEMFECATFDDGSPFGVEVAP